MAAFCFVRTRQEERQSGPVSKKQIGGSLEEHAASARRRKEVALKGKKLNHTVWKCEQYRAGQVTNRVIFDSRDQADDFVAKMQRVEPDIFWRVEPVEARLVWN